MTDIIRRRYSFASPPAISLGEDARITTRTHPADPDAVIVSLSDGREALVGDLYLSRDAARDLVDAVSKAIEDAPGTSKPAGAA